MTREEASRNLRRFKNSLDTLSESVLIQSVDMAIEALSAKTDGDTISRQNAVNALNCDIKITGKENAELVAETIGTFVDRIKRLQSADRPSGKWKEVWSFEDEIGVKTYVLWCQNCGALYRTRRVYTPNVHNKWEYVNSNFCPNCGARMKGGDDK